MYDVLFQGGLYVSNFKVSNFTDNCRNAVPIRTGTVRRGLFANRTAVGILLAIVGEIFVFFQFLKSYFNESTVSDCHGLYFRF